MTPNKTLWLLVVLGALVNCSADGPRIFSRLMGGHLRNYAHDDRLDSELLTSSAGGGREMRQQKNEDEEEKKTLAQQVADGKYGLIQKEIFTKAPKRPGILSYDNNAEVPKDNARNLGGLDKNEIWLAENHLLVLRGGAFPVHDAGMDSSVSVWPPIDDFTAPKRPVKIPDNPKVPPPFPVQLVEGGPLQILGTNASRTINVTVDSPLYPVPPQEGYVPGSGPFFPPPYPYPPNATSGEAPFPIPPYPPSGDGPPFPPFPFPINDTFPPGAVFLPPPGNQTDFDEDDPSIYYPPPYSFHYPKDNTSYVPPGPIVPGIVLPPPPDFFAPLEKRRKPTTADTPKQIHPTTTPIPATPVLENAPVQKPVYEISNEIKPVLIPKPRPIQTTPKSSPAQVAILRTSKPYMRPTHRKQPNVTILKPVEPTPSTQYVPPSRATIVSTTQVPLKSYYSEEVTQTPQKVYYTRRPAPTVPVKPKKANQYYFYEDDPAGNAITTSLPYHHQQDNYYTPPKQKETRVNPQQPQYYYYNTTPRPKLRYLDQQKPDTFKSHIDRLRQQIQYYYTTTPRPVVDVRAKPVYQYSFQAANYQEQHNKFQQDQDRFRPLPKYSVQIQPAVEITTRQTPNYYQVSEVSSERPSRYYTTPRPPQYDYVDSPINRNPIVVTPRPLVQSSYNSSPNPVYQSFFTSQDEQQYVDDNTKNYFTIFGKKISNTTPLPPQEVTRRPVYYPQEVTRKPVSLEGDILVNYVNPRPTINPDAEEFVPIQPKYPQVAKYAPQPPRYLHDDVNVNYKRPRPAVNVNAEIIRAVNVPIASSKVGEGQPGSFISYELPGDNGAHFYFLTPQIAEKRDREPPGVVYYYAKPSEPRQQLRRDAGR